MTTTLKAIVTTEPGKKEAIKASLASDDKKTIAQAKDMLYSKWAAILGKRLGKSESLDLGLDLETSWEEKEINEKIEALLSTIEYQTISA